jgi:hypothetical protein
MHDELDEIKKLTSLLLATVVDVANNCIRDVRVRSIV